MGVSTARIMPPTAEEIEFARVELRDALLKTECQPISTMRGADEVFAEKRKMLEELLGARV